MENASEEFCCKMMSYRISESYDESGEIKYDEVDVVINKWKNGTFGLPIHDGGTSMITINFCPWCGSKLTNSTGENGTRMIEIE